MNDHLIFDFDGTLSDSYPVFVRLYREVAEKHGIKVTLSDGEIYRFLKITAEEAYRRMDWRDVTFADYMRDFRELQHRAYLEFRLFPGAEAVLREIMRRGKKNYLYTHTGHFVTDTLRNMGIGDCFTGIIDLSCGFPFKPAPDALNALVERYSLRREDCLMIGDRPIDVQAGKNAGIRGCLIDPENLFPECKTNYKIGSITELTAII